MVITRVDHVAIKTSASAGSSIYISHYPCNCRINIHFHPDHVTSSLPAWRDRIKGCSQHVHYCYTAARFMKTLCLSKVAFYTLDTWRDPCTLRLPTPIFASLTSNYVRPRPQIVVPLFISPYIFIKSQHTKTQIGFRFMRKELWENVKLKTVLPLTN